MSIKEALARGTSSLKKRDRRELDDWNTNLRRERYKHSIAFLERSGSFDLMRELAEIVKSDFPDVTLLQRIYPNNGEVGLQLEWDYEEPSGQFGYRRVKGISVHTDSISGFLAVHGDSFFVTISKEEWESSQEPLENALVMAFRQPYKFGSSFGMKNVSVVPIYLE